MPFFIFPKKIRKISPPCKKNMYIRKKQYGTMKGQHALLLITALTLLLPACREEVKFELTGQLADLNSDRILVVYDDPVARLDTIFPKNGAFTYTFTPDTFTNFRLVNDSGICIPIFASKGWKVSLKGSFRHPEIEGDGPNNDYRDFLNAIAGHENDTAFLRKQAEIFIPTHSGSFASAYVLSRCFIRASVPDPVRTARLLEPLTGRVKDCRVLAPATLPDEGRKGSSPFVGYFACRDRNGKYVAWNDGKDTYTLICFWASWDPASISARDSLARLLGEFPQGRIRGISISLDTSRKEWLAACREDTEQWTETCDFRGWDSQPVRQNAVGRLPACLLTDRSRRILADGLHAQELREKLKQLIR